MSNNTTSTSTYTGPGLPTLLTVLFVGLKLTGFINWSWWWVLSPLWISFAVPIVIIIFAIVIGLLLLGR